MADCSTCLKHFKTNWHLRRHLSKKTPCSSPNTNEPIFRSSDTNLRTHDTKNTTHFTTDTEILNAIKHSLSDTSCNFCFKVLSCKRSLNRHLLHCSEKSDYIRQLEIKLHIQVQSISGLRCRFCGYESKYASHVTRHKTTCKYRKKYKALLEQKLIQQDDTPSVINNNITVNNINLDMSSICNENYDAMIQRVIHSISQIHSQNYSQNHTSSNNVRIQPIEYLSCDNEPTMHSNDDLDFLFA